MRWLARNPQHKHGVHRYNLADFGLDPETVNHHFANYNQWLAAHLAALVACMQSPFLTC